MSITTPLILIVVILILQCTSVDSSRILVLVPKAQKSHAIVFEGIATALAEAGHYVTLVSPREFEHTSPNLKTIFLTDVLEKYEEASEKKNLQVMQMTPIQTINLIAKSTPPSLDILVGHPNITHLMKYGLFDLVIIEMFSTEVFIGLGQHFDAPVIVVSTFGPSQQTNDLVGNPSPLSHIPHALAQFSNKMSLLDRMTNLALETYEKCVLNVINIPLQVSSKSLL